MERIALPRERLALSVRSNLSMGLLLPPMRWILILMLACGPAFAQEPPAWFADSLLFIKEDASEAAKEGKRVMLYFGQDGCPYCTRLMEVNFRQARIVDKMRKNFVALAFNIWGDREVTWVDGR